MVGTRVDFFQVCSSSAGLFGLGARHYIDLLGEYGGCMKSADPTALELGQCHGDGNEHP